MVVCENFCKVHSEFSVQSPTKILSQKTIKTRQHSSRMHTARLETVCVQFQLAPLDVAWGDGYHHQKSLAGRRSYRREEETGDIYSSPYEQTHACENFVAGGGSGKIFTDQLEVRALPADSSQSHEAKFSTFIIWPETPSWCTLRSRSVFQGSLLIHMVSDVISH